MSETNIKLCPLVREIIRENQELRNVLQDLLNAYWDMSPLEYAFSKGLSYMDEEIGNAIQQKARDLLKTPSVESDSEKEHTVLSDDQILELWRSSKPSSEQNNAMLITRWKDGIDCEYPTAQLRALIELAKGQ